MAQSFAHPSALIEELSKRAEDATDKALAAFIKRHELGGGVIEPELSWDSTLALPRVLLLRELLLAGEALLEKMRSAGMDVDDACEAEVGSHDDESTDASELEGLAREAVAAFKERPNALRELAHLCYATPERRQWLLSLAE